MKTSTVLASLLFGAISMAAPVDKRALAYKTELVIVTETIYTTVWPGHGAKPSEAPAAFYEKPNPKPVEPKVTSTTPAYTPPVVSTPSPTPTPEQKPEQKPEEPAPVVEAPSTSAAPEPTPEPTKPAETPVQQEQPKQEEPKQQETTQETQPSTGGTGSTTTPSGTEYNGKMSFHTFDGNLGSCGSPIANTDFAVAMDARTFGASTYDVMTGEASNPWCGKTITIVNGAKSVQAKVMDLCAGCKSAQGLDLSFAVWDALVDSRDAGVVDMKWYA